MKSIITNIPDNIDKMLSIAANKMSLNKEDIVRMAIERYLLSENIVDNDILLAKQMSILSKKSFEKIWDNDEDAGYDKL